MTMVFSRVETPGIAQLSYLIGDDGSGTAAVIDPRPDVEIYLQIARDRGVAITHVFETHIHADFMSGSRELAARLGSARLCVSGEEGASYGFEVEKIGDGERFVFGSVVLTARHTPGHTPEHLSYEVAEKGREDEPWGVFTGDSLFVGSAGRPDLLGDEETEELVDDLFHTLRDYFLGLDEGVIIYPCHGAGSACGADIGERPMGSIGYERQTNPFLRQEDLEGFREFVVKGAPPEPRHYSRLKKINAEGPPLLGGVPPIRALPPEEFQKALEAGDAQLVDVRQMLAFGGGHVQGAVNIGSSPQLSVWAGQMLDAEKEILLVVEHERDLDRVLWLFVNTGFTRFAGYLAGGMQAWSNQGLALERLAQTSVHELNEHLEDWQVLDVRTPDEWERGHLPGARHLYVADLRDGLDGVAGLERKRPLAVYCGSGYRASIAASLLRSREFTAVHNIPGSWKAWKEAGFEVETPSKGKEAE